MTEKEKRYKLVEFLDACVDVYTNCQDCPIYEGSQWCKMYSETSLPSDRLDDVLEEMTNAFGHLMGEAKQDMVNHPSHYNREGAMETIDEMELLFGLQATYDFCRLNAWKYRARANAKNGEEDMQKSDWYIRKAAELKTKLRMEGAYDRRTESI